MVWSHIRSKGHLTDSWASEVMWMMPKSFRKSTRCWRRTTWKTMTPRGCRDVVSCGGRELTSGFVSPNLGEFFPSSVADVADLPLVSNLIGETEKSAAKKQTAGSASTIRRTSWNGPWNRQGIWGRRSGVWSQEQLKWAHHVCNDGASPSTYYDGWPSSNQTWRVGFP